MFQSYIVKTNHIVGVGQQPSTNGNISSCRCGQSTMHNTIPMECLSWTVCLNTPLIRRYMLVSSTPYSSYKEGQ